MKGDTLTINESLWENWHWLQDSTANPNLLKPYIRKETAIIPDKKVRNSTKKIAAI
jgi:hypothetical protein